MDLNPTPPAMDTETDDNPPMANMTDSGSDAELGAWRPAGKTRKLKRSRVESLLDSDLESDTSTKTKRSVSGQANATGPGPATRLKIPPIVIAPSAVDGTWPLFLMGLRDVCSEFEAKFRGDRLHIVAANVDAFRVLQRLLTSKKVEFHTFSLPQDAELKVALRGLHHTTDIQVILAELRAYDLEPTYVTLLPRKSSGSKVPTNTFFVKVKKTGKWEKIWGLTHLLGVRVTLDPFDPPRGINQCFRCQRFGHGSFNCNLPRRCVRCGEGHDHGACQLPEGATPSCCNCGGAHPASWRGCASHKEAERSRKRRDAQTSQPAGTKKTAAAPGRQVRAPKQSFQAKPLPKVGLNKGSFAAVASGSSAAPPPKPIQPPRKSVQPDAASVPTTAAQGAAPAQTDLHEQELTSSQVMGPPRRIRKRQPKKSKKGDRTRDVFPSVPGYEAEGDISDTETDTGPRARVTVPRPRPTTTTQRQQERHLPATPATHSQESSELISVRKLIVWMTKIIPVLLSGKGRSPPELLAELMTSLLSLLSDG